MADAEHAETLPPLYHACMADDRALVRKLLVEGADPNDGESVYHSAQLNRRECLELLTAHGADLSSRNAAYGNTPLYFLAGHHAGDARAATALEGMRWLLEHGADPNVTSEDMKETPLHALARNAWGARIGELLLAHGADADAKRADGRTPYVLAVHTGNTEMADFLRRRGASTQGVGPVDELLGACMLADETKARGILGAHPDLLPTLRQPERGAMVQAVHARLDASVRLMASIGFDLGWEGPWDGTPLHHAAWLGNAGLVRLLLSLGAPVNVRDKRYGSSPIAWAAHGSTNSGMKDADYVTVVDLLLEAGSEREPSFNRWNEPPESMASPDVERLLKTRGFAP